MATADGSFYLTILADHDNRNIWLADHKDSYWIGETVMLCAYRMKDGTIIAPSELMILAPEELVQPALDKVPYINTLDLAPLPSRNDTVYLYMKIRTRRESETNNYWFIPTVEIRIPEGIDHRLIDDVVIYSTRIHPLYNFEQIWNESGEWDDFQSDGGRDRYPFRRLYEKKNDLLNQPLYRVKEIPFSEFKEGVATVAISYNILEDAPTKPLYVPSQSLHTTAAHCYYEYNSRLHKADMLTKLFPGYAGFCTTVYNPPRKEGIIWYMGTDTRILTIIEIGDVRRQVCCTLTDAKPVSVGRIVCYPDYRAKQIGITCDGRLFDADYPLGDWEFVADLKQSLTTNYAYAILPSTNNVKYPGFEIVNNDPINREQIEINGVIEETNRLQVSAADNMFAMPFANSYRVGGPGERILAVSTVADELSATRFGAFPLYVFTDRGVWSMESGSGEVLYSNTVPVNHDRITNRNCMSAQNTVFYITSRGIHALQGRYSKLISEALDNGSGELSAYLSGAALHFQFKYGDMIVYNRNYQFAYVYSTESGVWSTREMTGRVLDNGEIVGANSISMLDQEQPWRSIECLIRTRPLKLGSTEFKRVETLVARLSSEDCFAHITLEGSNDCRAWVVLRNEWCNVFDRDMRLRRTSLSCKFFRVTIHLTANKQLNITGIDAEYYLKFVGLMR